MDLNFFRLDIDDLINEFAEGKMTMFTDMKRIWLFKKFSCIFEAKPNTKLGFFMQSLYAHCIGYMTSSASISHRLGGLYCLYCLHETQPFKPPFRIYLCTREMKRLKELVIDAKKENIGVVPILVSSMLERNLFLYGAIDLKEGSVEERVNELTDIQNARIQHANKKLFADTEIERYIHMDMGKELDIDSLKKLSRDYSIIKELAIKEAEKVVDTQDVNHIAKDHTLIGDVVGKTVEDWNLQKERFYQKTGLNRLKLLENQNFKQQDSGGGNFENSVEEDDNFCDELEQQLLSLTES
ncbi:hypothetical protein L1987_15402 [Smallanthus sonchifolius]|uniref:Uncharacterized protein n=1 Tax=Smallanthus sonchifolius TaxID=185202 RepID=A0ACB9J5I6_9ASTR|nr:hypothetical protein L1987_15402 [Smallanthus sonchifolius]